ncbi:MAG: hypothetical protein H6735_17905 [Alphaproteobacteria bacterium]|nr:hypothetical protein [Alphaproteobacteria bacterium]
MIAVALALLGTEARADEVVLRTITLVDGRRFDAEVLETAATGMQLRVAQGTMLVPFELLVDISPIPGSTPSGEPWRVLAEFPEDVEPVTDQVLSLMPALAPSHIGGTDDLSPIKVSELASCGTDILCMGTVLQDSPWRFVVVGTHTATGGLAIESLVSTSDDILPRKVEVSSTEPRAIWSAMHTALGLDTPGDVPPELVTTKRPRPTKPTPAPVPAPDQPRPVASASVPSASKVRALSFVPVPGISSMACKDGSGAAMALAVALPSTAAWVGLSAAATRADGVDFGVLSVAGFYGITVMANQWTGERSLRRVTTAALPAEHGKGAVAVVHVGF